SDVLRRLPATSSFFALTVTATTALYTLSLHDALPISFVEPEDPPGAVVISLHEEAPLRLAFQEEDGALTAVSYSYHYEPAGEQLDRKSTRLNSSHVSISYAVFCLKNKKTDSNHIQLKI